jgi:hypothetical protein
MPSIHEGQIKVLGIRVSVILYSEIILTLYIKIKVGMVTGTNKHPQI